VDPLEYCRGKSAPEGSSTYYASLFLEPSARAGVLALLALERELVEVVEECSDAAVAARKLAFWHEELGRGLDDRPRHPVTHALRQHAPNALDAGDVQGLLQAVHERVTEPQVRDVSALDASARATAGRIARATARHLAPGDALEADSLEATAVALERVRLLCLPRRAGQPPHTGIPLPWLSAAGATPDEVDAGGDSPAAAALRRLLLDSAREGLLELDRALAGSRGFAVTRIRLGLCECRALQRSGYVEQGVARRPLPLVLLWHAWRLRAPVPRRR
jgi:phytoene synthase